MLNGLDTDSIPMWVISAVALFSALVWSVKVLWPVLRTNDGEQIRDLHKWMVPKLEKESARSVELQREILQIISQNEDNMRKLADSLEALATEQTRLGIKLDIIMAAIKRREGEEYCLEAL